MAYKSWDDWRYERIKMRDHESDFTHAAQELIFMGWTLEELVEHLRTREFSYAPLTEWTE